MLPATALYAGVLGPFFLWLSVQVVRQRHAYRLALGTSHRLVERAVRAHGNFAEYAPFVLLILALCEINGLPGWAVHALGTALVAGRVLHAIGIAREPEDLRWRSAGMALTFAALGAGSAALLSLGTAEYLSP